MLPRIAFTFLVLVFTLNPALADTMAPYDLGVDDRLAAVEAELDSLRREKMWNEPTQEKCCDKTQVSYSVYGGGGVVFARPHFKESFQYSQINGLTGQQTLHPFQYDYNVTPRVWLGLRCVEGFGVHVDYWQYHHSGNTRQVVSDGVNVFSSHATTVIFPATILADNFGEMLTAHSSLETHIVNLLGTYHAKFEQVDVRAGMGLRYVHLTQELGTSVVNSQGTPQGILNWSRNYEGVGPAVVIEARRALGASGFSLIGGGGGGLLFGTKRLDRLVLGDVGFPPAAPFLRLDDADEVVGVGELNFGLEWAHVLRNKTQFSMQCRYEGQLWAEAGAPTLGFLGFEGFGLFAELRR